MKNRKAKFESERIRRNASLTKLAGRLEKMGAEMTLVARQMATEPIIPIRHSRALGGAAGIVEEWVREIRRLSEL